MDNDPRLVRVQRKLRDNKPINDDDHIDVMRVYLEHNPDPQFVKDVRENIKHPTYLNRIRMRLNEARAQTGLPAISKRQFQRLVYIIGRST